MDNPARATTTSARIQDGWDMRAAPQTVDRGRHGYSEDGAASKSKATPPARSSRRPSESIPGHPEKRIALADPSRKADPLPEEVTTSTAQKNAAPRAKRARAGAASPTKAMTPTVLTTNADSTVPAVKARTGRTPKRHRGCASRHPPTRARSVAGAAPEHTAKRR